MADMVERVARAIATRNGDDYDAIPAHKSAWVAAGGQFAGRFRDVNEPYQTDYDEMAEAAIEAMRKPTDEMLDATGGDCRKWAPGAWDLMMEVALPSPPVSGGE